MNQFSIYKITNLVNGKVYIGKTTNFSKRMKDHIKLAKGGSGTIFHKAIRKHGIESFKSEVIFNTLVEKDLNEFEIYFINEEGSCILDDPDGGYNMTRGGEGISSELSSRINRRLVELGTHPFLGTSEVARKRELEKSMRGVHQWNNSEHLAKSYFITFPDGTEKRITNLTKFCRENKLNESNLGGVARGQRKQHKGFRARFA